MLSTEIRDVHARQILDCKARPVLEIVITTEGGKKGIGCAPTGTSVGMHEAYVLRDGNPQKYDGLSVEAVAENINTNIAALLRGMNVLNQNTIDEYIIKLDGTPNKSKLGGNVIYSISIGAAKAAAATLGMDLCEYLSPKELKTLPVPTYNLINGGAYPEFSLAFQEFSLVPYGACCMAEAVEIGVKTFNCLGKVISKYKKGAPASMGNYFGWAPVNDDPRTAMELIAEAVALCGYENKVAYALDCASSEMYDAETKTYLLKNKRVEKEAVIEEVRLLCEQYNILYAEDILEENDWDGFKEAVRILDKTVIIGDDFTVTNTERIEKAYKNNCAGGFVFKPNQIGTISESIKAYSFAKERNMLIVPSGRAGGIIDDVVMDMAVALEAPAVKNGAPRSGERINQINYLLRAADNNPDAKLYDLSHLAAKGKN